MHLHPPGIFCELCYDVPVSFRLFLSRLTFDFSVLCAELLQRFAELHVNDIQCEPVTLSCLEPSDAARLGRLRPTNTWTASPIALFSYIVLCVSYDFRHSNTE